MDRIISRTGWILAGVLALLVLASISGVVWGGPLNPPGPPSVPTGKTQINSLPTTISVPGSYILNSDLFCTVACSSGQSGITIAVSNVTLDLQGFQVSGFGSASGAGIIVSGTRSNIEIRNGTVANWNRVIDADAATGGLMLDDLRISDSYNTAVSCANGTIRNSIVSGNNSIGIAAAGKCTVADNEVINNGAGGITVSSTQNAILNNTLSGNGGTFVGTIRVDGNNNRLDGNVIDANLASAAIYVVGSFNVITRNSGGNVAGTPFDYFGASNTFGPTQLHGTPLSNPWANIHW